MKQIVFSGCGGLYTYFFGIASHLQKEFDLSDAVFASASGGGVPAIALGLGMDIEKFQREWNLPFLSEIRQNPVGPIFRWYSVATKHALVHLPDDAHERLSDRLFLSLTEVPSLKNTIVSQWESRDDLLDCFVASSFIPILHTKPWLNYRGKRYVDGGISNNTPRPFPRLPATIFTPSRFRQMKLKWHLMWTDEDWHKELFRWGQEDAKRYIHEIKADLRLPG